MNKRSSEREKWCLRKAKRRTGKRGFTVIEALVALSISAMVMGAVSLVFQSITANSRRLSNIVTLELGTAILQNFYNLNEESINVYTAPHYGRGAFAEELRELLWEDVSKASAVYCLPRVQLNNVRPTEIDYPGLPDSGPPALEIPLDRPPLDTPAAFREHLVNQFPAAATIFESYRTIPPGNAPHGTIFVMEPSSSNDKLNVLSIFEIDLINYADPAGTYASVRRYVDGNLTHYYDVFYPESAGTAFHPLFVAFERRSRLFSDPLASEGADLDDFKWAANEPFYFIWWPDPAAPFLKTPSVVSYPSGDPRRIYGDMGGRTAFMFTVPLFPSQ